jgi:hypothetical protein
MRWQLRPDLFHGPGPLKIKLQGGWSWDVDIEADGSFDLVDLLEPERSYAAPMNEVATLAACNKKAPDRKKP